MKAAVLTADREIRYMDYPEQAVTAGTVKVRVRAAGICGSDVPRVLHRGAHFYPIVLGHEFSGEVAEVGSGVTEFRKGDRVSGIPLKPCLTCGDCRRGDYALCKSYSFVGSREQGAFAEYLVLPKENLVKFDAGVSFEEAAFFEPIAVALHGILHSGYRGGGDALILGGGTIGLITMQLCKIMGAKSVTVVDIVEERLRLAEKLGADQTFNSSKDGFLERAKQRTEGRGYSDVFETAGNPATMKMSFALAGNHANVCFIGTPSKEITFLPSEFEQMNRKEFRLTGSWMSYSAPFPGREWTLAAHYLATKQLKIDESFLFQKFPLAEAAEAFRLFENPAEVKGKVMLII